MVPFTISYGQRRTNIVGSGSVEDYYSMYAIFGVDEVGLGSVAGPLVICAVHLPSDHDIKGLRDSKKMTSASIDSKALEIMNKTEVALGEMALTEDIDEYGIRKCHSTLIRKLANRVEPLEEDDRPILFVIDGTWDPSPLNFPFVLIKRAEDKSHNVAAASIVAKAVRDRMMKYAAIDFPGYGFESNKGYPTQEHKEAVIRMGVTSIHRRSYTNFYR